MVNVEMQLDRFELIVVRIIVTATRLISEALFGPAFADPAIGVGGEVK